MRTKQEQETARRDVFIRAFWRYNRHGKIVPNPGAKRTYLARGVSRSVALQMCQEWNAENDPGPLSIKAEFDYSE